MDRAQTWAFTFDVFGAPVFPSAPYYQTSPTAPSLKVSDRPISITDSGETFEWGDRAVSRRQSMAVSKVRMDVEAHSFLFALGPRARFHPSGHFSILAQAAATLNLRLGRWHGPRHLGRPLR